MDQRNFPYCMKNIPVLSKKLYLKILIDKVELLIKRMRWKALFFENESGSTSEHGFKTCKCPPQHKDLMKFENDFQRMISNVQFRRVKNNFQNRLKNDIRSIQSSKKVFVFADKTRNIYEMEKAHYEKLLTDNITKTYKQSNNNVYNSINLEAKHIAKKLEIADRIECMARKPAYITIKDHKENFNINPKCRLINPAKSELMKVAKIIVENINKTVREKLHCN